ncbi:hypothetical protein GCM10010297_56630 [Streptomyces malachitofuscus]|nr:hypothetical protein GCM10010297_56630 [Streptomyces malachitofuscus]
MKRCHRDGNGCSELPLSGVDNGSAGALPFPLWSFHREELPLRLRRTVTGALGSVALLLASTGAVTMSAGPAAAAPCGFYETASDAYYNHCTSDGSRIVIEIDDWGPNSEQCVGPGVTWIGSSSGVDGAWYTGRTC